MSSSKLAYLQKYVKSGATTKKKKSKTLEPTPQNQVKIFDEDLDIMRENSSEGRFKVSSPLPNLEFFYFLGDI